MPKKSTDWREKLKDRERANELRLFRNYMMGIPNYTGPDLAKSEKSQKKYSN